MNWKEVADRWGIAALSLTVDHPGAYIELRAHGTYMLGVSGEVPQSDLTEEQVEELLQKAGVDPKNGWY